MISVRNHRQLLNGNRLLTIMVFSVCLISCSFVRSITNPPIEKNDPVVDAPVEKQDEKPENEADKPINKPVKIKTTTKTTTVWFKGDEYTVEPHKTEFRIALILPFYVKPKSRRQESTSDLMVQYYQGVKLALEELESNGFKAKFYVYDNKNDLQTTKSILGKNEMKNMDLIIGPIRESYMQLVSDFGVRHKIPVFSPISTVNTLKEPNKYFYSMAPSYKEKAHEIVRFLEKHHPKDKFVILEDGSSYNEAFVPHLIEALKSSGKILYTKESYSNYNNWMELLSPNVDNVVYIPSYKRAIVNAVLGRIVSTKRKATVFGESNWTDFEDNDYNFWEKLEVHLISTDFVNTRDSLNRDFRLMFRENYEEDPALYAYLGYDQMTFIGEFFMAFGQHFPLYITNKNFQYLSTNYRFEFKGGFHQNTRLFFLKYEDHQLVPVE
jgi:hypothetical protein